MGAHRVQTAPLVGRGWECLDCNDERKGESPVDHVVRTMPARVPLDAEQLLDVAEGALRTARHRLRRSSADQRGDDRALAEAVLAEVLELVAEHLCDVGFGPGLRSHDNRPAPDVVLELQPSQGEGPTCGLCGTRRPQPGHTACRSCA